MEDEAPDPVPYHAGVNASSVFIVRMEDDKSHSIDEILFFGTVHLLAI